MPDTFDEQQQAYARTVATRRHVAESAVVDAPLVDVWRVVRDFGAGERWLPGVESSEIEGGRTGTTVGAVRRLYLMNGGSTREQLVGLSDVRHVVEIAVVETAMPVTNYVATWTLSPVSESGATLMSWAVEFDGADEGFEQLGERLRMQIFRPGFAGLRAAIATGTTPGTA